MFLSAFLLGWVTKGIKIHDDKNRHNTCCSHFCFWKMNNNCQDIVFVSLYYVMGLFEPFQTHMILQSAKWPLLTLQNILFLYQYELLFVYVSKSNERNKIDEYIMTKTKINSCIKTVLSNPTLDPESNSYSKLLKIP